ncbi:MAG: hypothetical protein ACFFER_18065 [Candidatus Thorarchaeota archaeon]
MCAAKIKLPKVSMRKRSKLLNDILEDSGASAMLEFWKGGSIVRKPTNEFTVILVFDSDE